MSPANSLSNFSIMSPSPNSSTSEHAQMISLLCFGLPLHTTLSLLPEPILDLLVFHFFHSYLEELPTEILHSTFVKVFLSLTQVEQCLYLEQVGQPLVSPAAIFLALCLSSPPPSPAIPPVNNNNVIHIQITKGQWITFPSSQVLVQCSWTSSPNALCYVCSDLSYHGLFCPMYTCLTCQETILGNAAHHCLETQCDLCHQWGHFNNVCNLQICGGCNTPEHVVDNCPVNQLIQLDAHSTYHRTYSDDNNLNTLVDGNWGVWTCQAWGLSVRRGQCYNFLPFHVFFLIFVVHWPYFCFAPLYEEVDHYLLAFLHSSPPLFFLL